MIYALPPLPYATDALEPRMSRETIEYHYGKHLQTYIDNLNRLIDGTPYEDVPLETLILTATGPLFNNAAQVWNHTFFFNSLTREDIEKIIDIEIKGLKSRVAEAGFELTITPAARKFVAEKGYDPKFGARPLKRAVQKHIEDPVSEEIIADRMQGGRHRGGKIRVGLTKDCITVEWAD